MNRIINPFALSLSKCARRGFDRLSPNGAARLAFLACVLPLAACETINPRPPVDIQQPTSMRPQAAPAPVINNGSIFQATQYRPLFEDHRARLVGDTITVQIVEKIAATQTATSSIDKSGTVSAGVTALPGITPNSFTNGRTSVGINSANTFAGKGSTVNSNDFSGTITATVIDVLPNGHLVISGEKQIGVNHNVDVLRFSGQVDPRAIQSGNTVPSAQIANVRIEQRGRGAQADAQGIGWLGRFFLNVLPI
ncbi:MAG TPA: flagellar basal body L-ring protein FlgH [Burkholderiaceae bacterium]